MSDTLDREALAIADAAFLNEKGTYAEKVAAAIVAYQWAMEKMDEQARNHGSGWLILAPSRDDWQQYRATLGRLR